MNDLFNDIDSVPSQSDRQPVKGMVVGCGQVGMACAYAMLIQNTLDELILVDANQDKLDGECMDLQHGVSFVEPTAVHSSLLEVEHGADIVVIAAGAKQHPGESRLQLTQKNVELFSDIIPKIVQSSPDAILVIVSNPVDIMTQVATKLSGLPPSRVIGSGTILDTARFRYLLSRYFKIDPRSLHGYIVGEHGDSEVPLWSTVNMGGTHICADGIETLPDNQAKPLDEIFHQVKNAAYEIIQRKGATCYAIGLGVTQLVQAILRNQQRVLTVSTHIQDAYGFQDVSLSLPTVLDRRGATRRVHMQLPDLEQQQLQHSAAVLRNVLDGIGF